MYYLLYSGLSAKPVYVWNVVTLLLDSVVIVPTTRSCAVVCLPFKLTRQLSEMNGRPLHIRQQQFQKESQYRNMLKDQIAENKKRKVRAEYCKIRFGSRRA